MCGRTYKYDGDDREYKDGPPLFRRVFRGLPCPGRFGEIGMLLSELEQMVDLSWVSE